MSLFSKFLVSTCFAFMLSSSMIPDNGTSVVITQDNEEYVYYKSKKNGIEFSKLDKRFSSEDSVRVKLFFRSIVPLDNKEKHEFKAILELNGKRIKNLRYNKGPSKLNIKGKYGVGRAPTQSGVWFVDIKPKDFSSIRVSGDKNIIVRAQVSSINRDEYNSFKSLNTINRQTKFIIDTKTNQTKNSQKSSYWYKQSKKSNELQFEVIGPTSIRIFTRLENPSTVAKDNRYTLFVKEDGLDIGTYFFNTEVSPISNLRSSKLRVGKWRTCWINVPKGKHYYTIRKGNVNKNPVYIKVKQYDK